MVSLPIVPFVPLLFVVPAPLMPVLPERGRDVSDPQVLLPVVLFIEPEPEVVPELFGAPLLFVLPVLPEPDVVPVPDPEVPVVPVEPEVVPCELL